MATREEVTERMKGRCRELPVRLLAWSLETLDRRPKLDDAERLTRAVLIDVICERCPAAEEAFEAWAQSDDLDLKAPIAAIIAAAREAGNA